MFAVLAAAFISVGLVTRDLDQKIDQAVGPHDGCDRSVSQYREALSRVRELALIASLGGAVADSEVERRVAVLRSKASLLTESSELRDVYQSFPGYADAVTGIEQFHRRVDPLFATPAAFRQHAGQGLTEFGPIDQVVATLANSARSEEQRNRGSSLDDLLARRRQFWWASMSGFGLLLAGVAAMGLTWERYRHAILGRAQAIEAAQRAVDARTKFLGMVSHELRAPLQSIVSALDVLETRHALPEQSQVTRRIRRSANELGGQLHDLLTLARDQIGRVEVRPDVFDAAELVREVVAEARPEALTQGLTLTAKLPGDAVLVFADSVRTRQVLQSLIANAMRYTRQGAVTVTLRDFDEQANRLVFVVSDTGPGLPDALRASLGNALGAGPPRHTGGGRGIGLAVVHTLVLQLGGTLSLSAPESSGTTFEVALPATPADAAHRLPEAAAIAR